MAKNKPQITTTRQRTHHARLNLSVDFGTGAEDFDILGVLKIEDNVEHAYKGHSGIYAIFAACLEACEALREGADVDLQAIEDDLRVITYGQLREEGMPVTIINKMLDTHVRRSDKWRAAKQKQIEFKQDERRLKHIVKAFEHRRDMLISLGAQMRHREAVEEGMRIITRGLKSKLS